MLGREGSMIHAFSTPLCPIKLSLVSFGVRVGYTSALCCLYPCEASGSYLTDNVCSSTHEPGVALLADADTHMFACDSSCFRHQIIRYLDGPWTPGLLRLQEPRLAFRRHADRASFSPAPPLVSVFPFPSLFFPFAFQSSSSLCPLAATRLIVFRGSTLQPRRPLLRPSDQTYIRDIAGSPLRSRSVWPTCRSTVSE